jgi:zinc transporter
MDDLTRMHLREFSDRLAKFLEDLEATRDRATVTQEELNSKNAEKMNRAMYMISIFTVVFLPLGLLTGLLGINVGGLPGVDNPSAFWIVCVIMTTLLAIQWWLFRRNKWI